MEYKISWFGQIIPSPMGLGTLFFDLSRHESDLKDYRNHKSTLWSVIRDKLAFIGSGTVYAVFNKHESPQDAVTKAVAIAGRVSS